MIDSNDYRNVLGLYPTGVCVVTAKDDEGTPLAMVVGSFTSISLDPPLVGFFPDKNSKSWAQMDTVQQFCINVLGTDQQSIANQMAKSGGDKFAGVAWTDTDTGHVRLDGALAWIDCKRDQVVELGDHWLVVGAVEELKGTDLEKPLVFFKGSYRTLDAVE